MTRADQSGNERARRDLSRLRQGIDEADLGAIADATDALEATIDLIAGPVNQRSEGAGEGEWKDAFLLAAAHDLRAPLAIIRMLSQTLIGRTELGLQATLVEQIDEQAARGIRLLNGLLDLSRFATGGVPLRRQPTDLATLVGRVVGEIQRNGHPLDVAVGVAAANVDPALTVQILTNLVTNALEHTPRGTPLHIVVEADEDMVRLVVEDEGPGVPDDLKSDVFAPFVTRRAHSGDAVGTGVGLTLVRLFAELHGGEARVEDRVGGGARFVVELGLWGPGAGAPSAQT